MKDTLYNAHLSIKDTSVNTCTIIIALDYIVKKDPPNKGHLSKRDTWFCPILYTSVYFRTE